MTVQPRLSPRNARRWIGGVNLQAVHFLSCYRMAWAPPHIDFSRLSGETNACVRLASMPVLLVDLCCSDDVNASAQGSEILGNASASPSSDAHSESLARQVLFLIWHLAQLGDPGLCLIDPSSQWVQRVRELELGALDRLAGRAACLLGVRWAGQPDYWHALIDTACQGHKRELEHLFVLGLQKIGAPSHARLIA